MRPVNLLPARYRPRTAGSGDSKTAYIALGALALLVLAVFGYVMAANKVSARNSEIAQTRQQIVAAEARSVTLQSFGDFAGVKAARLSAVKSLATARLDWDRLFRELAHVLPERVWLTGFDGDAKPSDAAAGMDEAGNALLLKGCADGHRRIADLMVRLRELHAAEDVELTKSTAPQEEDASAPAGTAGTEEGCGRYTTFEITVTLAAPAADPTADGGEPVPARLGGGA